MTTEEAPHRISAWSPWLSSLQFFLTFSKEKGALFLTDKNLGKKLVWASAKGLKISRKKLEKYP